MLFLYLEHSTKTRGVACKLPKVIFSIVEGGYFSVALKYVPMKLFYNKQFRAAYIYFVFEIVYISSKMAVLNTIKFKQ